MDEIKSCLSCKGNKTVHREGFTASTGEVFPDRNDPCSFCNGEGFFKAPKLPEILELAYAKKGKNKGKLRSAMSSYGHGQGINYQRAYYVWRMARFHGGVDVTMPVIAGMLCHGDPFVKELDIFSDQVAKENFGTDMAAAKVWGRALGF